MAQELEKQLGSLFGDYRAEWVQKQFGSLFVRPPYYDQLESIRPCFLVGGRGTGKTVALKSLRYDAVQLRANQQSNTQVELPYLGIYIRINKNRVRAFTGDVLPEEQWNRIFAHYFNLLVMQELAQLSAWLTQKYSSQPFSQESFQLICTTLGTGSCSNLNELQYFISESIAKLELYVNNPKNVTSPILSMAESPIRAYISALNQFDAERKPIFICIDEYENLLDYQQALLNTYIKHSEAPFSYKIGVRMYGLRTRNTIDSKDLLRSPEDYAEIQLTGGSFIGFCKRIVQHRLTTAKADGLPIPALVSQLLPSLDRDTEAIRLGAEKYAVEVVKNIRQSDRQELLNWVQSLSTADKYLLYYWSQAQNEDVASLAQEVSKNKTKWINLINNHGYMSLFSLSKGRKGARIRKFYAGEETFLALASGNIRYYLELIDESITYRFEQEQLLQSHDNVVVIDPEDQTYAAQRVAKRRLDQLEGLSSRGVELKRLILAIGKIFFEYARAGAGHSPEISTFVLSGPQSAQNDLLPLLQEGVGHLALEVMPRTKATSDLEMKDAEYRLHPIFAPFFEYSYRKKRRINLDARYLLMVQNNPRKAIEELLKGRVEQLVEASDLPQQLVLFSSFYKVK